MGIRKGVIDAHVFKEPLNVRVKEAFDLTVVELGIHKHGAEVSLNDVGETLCGQLTMASVAVGHPSTFGGFFVVVQ